MEPQAPPNLPPVLAPKEYLYFGAEAIIIAAYFLIVKIDERSDIYEIPVDYFTVRYPSFMDIHAMVFVGYGFLMAFLKTHSWSSVGFSFVIAVWAI